MPHASEEDIGVGRIEANVGGARVGILGQDTLPELPAIDGAVDASLRVGPKGVAQDRRKSDVRVGGMDNHRADLPLLVPHMLPGLARVGGFVDAVAAGHVAADVGFARADVDDVRVGSRYGDGADGRDRLVIKNGLPVDAGVGRLPDPRRGGSGIVGLGISGNAADAAV